MPANLPLSRLRSGVPGLDEVLGGGFPEHSFNLIAGAPGSGKTTMAHQIVFANASPARKALYFTVVGEPPAKMRRYQEQFSFFDEARVDDGSIRFVNLGEQAFGGGMARVLEAITAELERSSPALVVVDSFRGMLETNLEEGPGGAR